MYKITSAFLIMIISVSFILTGCGQKNIVKGDDYSGKNIVHSSTVQQTQNSTSSTSQTTQNQTTAPVKPQIDLAKIKPNEAGKIMVVMFHNFIETYTSGDKEYTTTFDEFRKLLQTLYDGGYRLISLNDYLSNNISTPAGYIPMVFTFDDGTAGQFNLVEENGKLVTNKNSAVGIMEEFNKTHPDFGLKATFYVNLGLKTFEGKGTVTERLKYLTDKGFEIGNHTYTHISLPDTKTADKIQQEVGGNYNKMLELIPGYKFTSLALPFGGASKDLQQYVIKGEYQGTKYENTAIMLVGANPAVSPVSKEFKPLSTPRVRATGLKAVDCDLAWWLKNISKADQYVSDGYAPSITIPKSKEANVDTSKLNGKELILY